MDRDWDVSDEDIEALTMERSISPNETDVQIAQRLFTENAPHAAKRIIELGRRANSERTRLDANKYIVDRVLGRLTDKGFNFADKDDPFTQLYEAVTRDATESEAKAIDRAKGRLSGPSDK